VIAAKGRVVFHGVDAKKDEGKDLTEPKCITGLPFLPATAIMLVMTGGMWVVLVIPAIIAFVFGAWVFYSMVVDVSERDTGYGGLNNCVEGCQVATKDMR
jgi:hypothetical protein